MISNKSYQLVLGNGLCWNISACDVAGKWLDKLANILRLEPAGINNLAKIIFCKMGDFPRVREWYHSEYRDRNSGRNTETRAFRTRHRKWLAQSGKAYLV